MDLPTYPAFAPLQLEMRPLLHPVLAQLPDGVSEFTFAGLYLFRHEYSYEIARTSDGLLLGRGRKNGRSFALLPQGLPAGPAGTSLLRSLLAEYDYIRGFPERLLRDQLDILRAAGIWAAADRDNYDYLYDRHDMADLTGKKFHKKRNLIHNFERTYPEHRVEGFSPAHTAPALEVLDRWRSQVQIEGDYPQAREAVELFDTLELSGNVVCIGGTPAAFSLGEPLAGGNSYVVHVEKGDHELKGIYQYIFRELVRSLPGEITSINREQDVGDVGLRQAKLTYRPIGYTRKFQLWASKPPGFPDQAIALSPHQQQLRIPADSELDHQADS
ncbi:DUF2156 domain-containing protein [Spirochaeta africana]|uniref:Phosphatidylglycerol lysyltransferase C-terminal domain-containing protein n=1 Tax=Spirochaeta africana (strain ATCC 700263 / DSM 8902 / Z-7692) TaxID=889378 RepID=H9UMM9_SPIAZ|nr:DUF2156 domain-containing protein [Spirochaeta africana]AFG38772.1 hypothetical protein Spiaf_2748 [Spirochaeta africana DSM 8902]